MDHRAAHHREQFAHGARRRGEFAKVELGRLEAEIGDPGDEKATLSRIESIWAVARPEVESTRPELLEGIDTTVDMATTAVVRIRPADADKAFQLLTGLVDRYSTDA